MYQAVVCMFQHQSKIPRATVDVPASKQDPQGYGSALTYARRYSLQAACGIAPEDDDGNAASKPKASVVVEKKESDRDHDVLKFMLESCENLNELKEIYQKMTPSERAAVADVKDAMKGKLQ